MIYSFLNFTLNTDTKELLHKNEKVHLTQQNYLLLKAFIEKTGSIVEKQYLMNHAWQGRVVQDNTIDQGISKLRKLLYKHEKADYISAGYGKGWHFIPEVNPINHHTKQGNRYWLVTALASVIGVMWLFWPQPNIQASNKSMVMVLSSVSHNPEQWWSSSSVPIIENFLGQSHSTIIKKHAAEEKQMNADDYLKFLRKHSPELSVINTAVKQNQTTKAFELQLTIDGNDNPTYTKTFSGPKLSLAYQEAGQWLVSYYGLESTASPILPINDLAVQLFMQGVANLNQGEVDKSVDYFSLSLQEMPEFGLARLKLAESLKKQNQLDRALSHINTLLQDNNTLSMQLNAIAIKGDIFEIRGQHEAAKTLYEETLDAYGESGHPTLNEIRYYLSDVYFSLADNQAALEQLNQIEHQIQEQEFPYLLADTYRQQGQIHFINGQFQQAKEYTQKALKLYTDLGYLVGQIKAYASLSRFLQHEHKYKEAIGYINKALALARIQGNKLIIGASINQLIYLLNTQGHISEAWELNLEMENIGLEVGFTRMVIAAKHHFAELARYRRNFQLAKANLDEHLRLAIETNNKRAIHTNNLLMLDYLLDQKNSDGVQTLIDQVQQHINDTGELRLQPVVNLKQAQLNSLLGKTDHIVALLEQSLQQAKQTEDGETIVLVNNFLSEFYLSQGQYDKALEQLNQNNSFHPAPNPHLILKAKIYQKQGKLTQAVELLNRCKLEANERWYEGDEQLLQQLKKQLSNQI